MKNLKSLSLVLVLTVVFSSFALSAFAAVEDRVIVSSIEALPKLINFKTGVTPIEAKQTGNVLSLKSSTFASNTLTSFSHNSAGMEARYCLVPTSGGKLGGDIDWSQYKNLRIEFNIKIANDTDGISFRTQRYNDSGDITGVSKYYVFSVGGSGMTSTIRPANSTGYSYYTRKIPKAGDSSLSTGVWHNVVIEIGANSANTAVKFYIDNEDVSSYIKVLNNGTEITENPMNIHDGSVGFGGGSVNKCVLIPNGKKDSLFGVELSGLKMTATNTDFTPRAGGKIIAEELKGTANTETGKIDTSAIVYNLTDETKNVKLIIAYYDSEGNLADVKTEVISVANTLVNNVNKAFDKPSAYASAKVFLWTDTEIIPLSKSADVVE